MGPEVGGGRRAASFCEGGKWWVKGRESQGWKGEQRQDFSQSAPGHHHQRVIIQLMFFKKSSGLLCGEYKELLQLSNNNEIQLKNKRRT